MPKIVRIGSFVVFTAVVVLVVGSVGASAQAPAAHRHKKGVVKVINDCAHAHKRPKAITLDCWDGRFGIDRIHWAKWRSKQAVGHGREVWTSEEGSGGHRRVVVVLSRPATRNGGAVHARVFTRLAVKWVDKHHKHHKYVERLSAGQTGLPGGWNWG